MRSWILIAIVPFIAGAQPTLTVREAVARALAASFGFLPMALSTSPGAEVQRPLATVVIGLVSATGLTLFLLPLVYPWFASKDL